MSENINENNSNKNVSQLGKDNQENNKINNENDNDNFSSNSSHDSEYYHEQAKKLYMGNQQQEVSQSTNNDKLKEEYLQAVQQREKIFEEAESQIQYLKELTSSNKQELEYKDDINEKQVKVNLQRVFKDGQIDEIKQKVKEIQEHDQKQFVYAEEEIEKNFVEENPLYEDSVDSEAADQVLDIDNNIKGEEEESVKVLTNNALSNNQNPQQSFDAKITATNNDNNNSIGNNQGNVNGMRQSKLRNNPSIIQSQMKNQSSLKISMHQQKKRAQELDLKRDQMKQEMETIYMEQEDALSLEYEEHTHWTKFNQKNWLLPSEFIVPEQQPSNEFSLFFEHPPVNFQSQSQIVLQEISEENLAPKNTLEACQQDYQSIKNKRKKWKLFKVKPTPQKGKVITLTNNNLDNENSTNGPVVIDINFDKKYFEKPQNDAIESYYHKILEIFQSTLKKAKGQIEVIKKLVQSYNPQQLSSYYDCGEQQQLAENALEESMSEKSIKQFAQKDQVLKKKLEIKFESVADLDGLSSFINLQILILSMNKITTLQSIEQATKLVELNLSQNQITNYEACGSLQHLRILNLELNQITAMSPLRNCSNLEVLNLSQNKIGKINNLQYNRTLKKLILFQNKIEKIENLDQLCMLEEIDLGHNELKSIDGLENNILLRKLILYHNKISEIPKDFSFLFLIEMYLNQNNLKNISGFKFLPCLQYLNLSNNEMTSLIEPNQLIYLSNVTTLYIGYNKLLSFTNVLNFLQHSPQLQFLQYDGNPFISHVSDDIYELYEYLYILQLSQIKEINNKGIEIGHLKYLENKFSSMISRNSGNERLQAIINENENENEKENGLRQIGQVGNETTSLKLLKLLNVFSTISREYEFCSQLEQQLIKKQSSFVLTLDYFSYKFRSGLLHLEILLNSNDLTINQYNSIYHMKDIYEEKFRISLRIIKNSLIKYIYNRRKMKARLRKNLSKIIKIQALFRGIQVRSRSDVKKIVRKKLFESKAKYAIRIQKVVRGFLVRKRKKVFFSKINYDVGEFEEFDMTVFDKLMQVDDKIKIPQCFDIGSIDQIQSQQQEIQSQLQMMNTTNKPLKMVKEMEEEEEEVKLNNSNQFKGQPHPNPVLKKINNYNIDGSQQKFSTSKINKQEEANMQQKHTQAVNTKLTSQEKEQIAQDWGFQKQDVINAFAYRLEKERKRKANQNKKQLTATERYQQFIKMNQK